MPPMRTAELRSDRARLSSADWETGALDLLAEQGVAAVAVEPLARRLGVTKGSFYWHFPSREALLKAALERWERLDETTVFAPLEEIADARARLRELFVSTSREMRTHVLYSELLKALDHPVVQPVMARVSQRRIHFLMQAYRALNFSRRDAMDRARLVYSAYVGYLQLMLQLKLTRMSAEEFDAYVLHVVETFIPRE
ncbi:MAG: TetR/AcrR family transcriptional regulator [Xanthomonadales bacterium]|nr:TetR/AcrR family transcriptional regulator [Xanthomonadales bacterium]